MRGRGAQDGCDLLGRRRQGHGQRQARLEVRGLVATVRLTIGLVGEQAHLRRGGAELVQEGGHQLSMVSRASVQDS